MNSLGGGPITVAGYAWLPSEPASTAVLALHGANGVALAVFGPTIVPGYSMAHRVMETGRAFFVIDRPGYGQSETIRETQAHEDHAWVVAQVADQLRSGQYSSHQVSPVAFEKIVGVGHSLGGNVLMQSEGDHQEFDAIVSIGWTHAGYREEFRDCINGSGTCPNGVDMIVWRPNLDPRFIGLLENSTTESNPGSVQQLAIVASGCWGCLDENLSPLRVAPDVEDLHAAKIEAPTLFLLGKEDFIIQETSTAEEQSHFLSTSDVTVETFPQTGHMIWHHLNHEQVFTALFEWLDSRAL